MSLNTWMAEEGRHADCVIQCWSDASSKRGKEPLARERRAHNHIHVPQRFRLRTRTRRIIHRTRRAMRARKRAGGGG